ncbi:Protein of unknown function [Pyronema omphalodes CBS 100304]|uniref:Uncharacterized protein n=1 Tax=Pyronema omphalodes (strain CBS 100304) TaxID=1076935 RepID=U4LYG3_PYROM|nr:Protein of unknown function [Pyronema omphalodes CBS 100304]
MQSQLEKAPNSTGCGQPRTVCLAGVLIMPR